MRRWRVFRPDHCPSPRYLGVGPEPMARRNMRNWRLPDPRESNRAVTLTRDSSLDSRYYLIVLYDENGPVLP